MTMLVLSLLMSVPGSVPASQDKTAPEGLTGGKEVVATSDSLEGTWSAFHVYTGKSGGWKHSGTFTITNVEGRDGLQVKFTSGNGGGDNPNAENRVEFSGSQVTLNRDVSPIVDFYDKSSSQTWVGTLYEDEDGHLKIEGHVNGTGMTWELQNGKNATTFVAFKK